MRPLALLLLVACTTPEEVAPGPAAIVDASRTTHFFDVPFPTDDLLVNGRPDLSGFPSADGSLLGGIVGGWVRRTELATRGFAGTGPIFFRFEGPLEVPETLTGVATDPIVLVDLDTAELLPLQTRFVEDPGDDPFLAPNTLTLIPPIGAAPRSGARVAAVVSMPLADSAGVEVPADVLDALARAGVTWTPAVSTTFTVQPGAADLRALVDDIDLRMDALTHDPQLRRVTRLRYAPGTTPSGVSATVATVTYEDGTTDETYLVSREVDHEVVFDDDWPMVVYEGRVQVPYYTGFDDQPYMSPGAGHLLLDMDRDSGWIDVDEGGVVDEPDLDEVRFVLSMPRGPDGQPAMDAPVVLWDHGTTGHAYNSVQRLRADHDGPANAAIFAETGWAVLGHDLPMYGQRYPLMDEGVAHAVITPPARARA